MKHYRFVIRNKRKVEVRYTWAERTMTHGKYYES